MNWSQLQLDAKAKGYLVYAMSQAQTDVVTQPGPWGSATTGYCAGLCVRWISLRYAKQDYPFDAATKESTGTQWQATAIQNYIDDTTGVADPGDWYKAELAKLRMSLSLTNRATRANGPSGAFVQAVVNNAYGCYLVHLRRNGGAHCLSIQHGKDNKLHLFDANQGHFTRTGSRSFQAFLDWYFKASNYATRYTSTWVCGVKPG